jgi:hypothetical protein
VPNRRYPITPDKRAQIRRLLGEVNSRLGTGTGESDLSPNRTIRILNELLAPTVVNPEDFLYLCLPPEVLERPIVLEGSKVKTGQSAFELSGRPYDCIKREDTHTVGHLLQWSEAELCDIQGLGSKSLGEVKTKLQFQGWHLSLHDIKPLAPPAGDRWVELEMQSGGSGIRLKRLHSLAMRRSVGSILPASFSKKSEIVHHLEQHGLPTIGHIVGLGAAKLSRLPWTEAGSNGKLDLFWAASAILGKLKDCNIPMPA